MEEENIKTQYLLAKLQSGIIEQNETIKELVQIMKTLNKKMEILENNLAKHDIKMGESVVASYINTISNPLSSKPKQKVSILKEKEPLSDIKEVKLDEPFKKSVVENIKQFLSKKG